MPFTIKTINRFKSKFKEGDIDSCWNWESNFTTGGYGTFKSQGKRLQAHRVSYRIYKGMVSASLCVCHTCDNRACVNPNHLFLGTQAENLRDRDAKGRQSKGETCARSKLTEAQVLEIRELAKTMNYRQISRKMGISSFAVSYIVRRICWKHI